MMELFIAADGQIRGLYGEEIPLEEFGGLSICRASHVEPDRSGVWLADMSPVGGPAWAHSGDAARHSMLSINGC